MNEERIASALLGILEDFNLPAEGRVEAARVLLDHGGWGSEPVAVVDDDEKVSELMTCARLVLDDYRSAIDGCERDGVLFEDEAAGSRELADDLDAAITALEGEE